MPPPEYARVSTRSPGRLHQPPPRPSTVLDSAGMLRPPQKAVSSQDAEAAQPPEAGGGEAVGGPAAPTAPTRVGRPGRARPRRTATGGTRPPWTARGCWSVLVLPG